MRYFVSVLKALKDVIRTEFPHAPFGTFLFTILVAVIKHNASNLYYASVVLSIVHKSLAEDRRPMRKQNVSASFQHTNY
jgi:hypothetical protein